MDYLHDLLNKAPSEPKSFLQRVNEGIKHNTDGGPSDIPGYNRVLDPEGHEVGLMVQGGDPARDDEIMSREAAKREIARSEGMPNVKDKDLDAVVKQSMDRKPSPPLERPNGFDYIGA